MRLGVPVAVDQLVAFAAARLRHIAAGLKICGGIAAFADFIGDRAAFHVAVFGLKVIARLDQLAVDHLGVGDAALQGVAVAFRLGRHVAARRSVVGIVATIAEPLRELSAFPGCAVTRAVDPIDHAVCADQKDVAVAFRLRRAFIGPDLLSHQTS